MNSPRDRWRNGFAAGGRAAARPAARDGRSFSFSAVRFSCPLFFGCSGINGLPKATEAVSGITLAFARANFSQCGEQFNGNEDAMLPKTDDKTRFKRGRGKTEREQAGPLGVQ